MPRDVDLDLSEGARMKLRSLLILLVVAIGVGLYLYYGVQKASEQKTTEEEKESKLAKGDLGKLQSISFTINDKKIDLQKDQGNWRLTSPVQDLASESKVDNFSAALGRFKKMKELRKKEDIATADFKQYGLNPPKVKIVYKTTDLTEPVTISLGSDNPNASGVYAQVGDAKAPILLATMDLDFLATQNVDDFREMRLVTADVSKYSEVSIRWKGNAKELKFKRDTTGNWIMTAPYELPIDQQVAKDSLEKIEFIRANKFEKELPKNAGTPEIQVIVGFKEGVKDMRTTVNDHRPNGTEILFYKVPKPISASPPSDEKPNKKTSSAPKKRTLDDFDYFAKTDKTDVASIARFHFDNFTKSPEDFIRKSFDDFAIADVQKMTIHRPKLPDILVAKTPQGYLVTKGKETKNGSKDDVEKALNDLHSLHATKFLESRAQMPKPTNPNSPEFVVTLELSGQKSHRFAFDFAKDAAYLWYSEGEKDLKYVFGKDPLNTKDFDFENLSKAVAASPKPAEKELKTIDEVLKSAPSAKNNGPQGEPKTAPKGETDQGQLNKAPTHVH